MDDTVPTTFSAPTRARTEVNNKPVTEALRRLLWHSQKLGAW